MAKRLFSDMEPEERAECGRKGGIKSGEVRRNRKDIKETLKIFLETPLHKKEIEDVEGILEAKGKNLLAHEKMLIAQMIKAMNGDTAAFKLLMELSGNMPKEDGEPPKPQIDRSFIDALNGKAAEVWKDEEQGTSL